MIPASNTTGQNSIGDYCSSHIPDDRREQAAVKMSGMAADRAERGSWRKPRTVTLHTLRAEVYQIHRSTGPPGVRADRRQEARRSEPHTQRSSALSSEVRSHL